MILTDAKLTKGKNMAVFFDDEFAFSMSPLIWEQENLTIGMEITPERANELFTKSGYQKAKDRAFYLLSGKSYSKKKLKEKLCEKEPPEIADMVVERMEELGLVNDENYCRDYVDYLISVKNCGKRKIIASLTEKGIDRNIIEDVLSQTDFSDEYERAKEKALKKKRGNDPKEKNRIYSYLLRNGFDYSVIKEVLNDIFEVEETDYEL